mmetsp:Transcript_111908/g.316589  ORF Transcript_111908/g.316589 Transcript_111908/m.316589 type:complete len:95 (-) Transcript_111908:327-611(-)
MSSSSIRIWSAWVSCMDFIPVACSASSWSLVGRCTVNDAVGELTSMTFAAGAMGTHGDLTIIVAGIVCDFCDPSSCPTLGFGWRLITDFICGLA